MEAIQKLSSTDIKCQWFEEDDFGFVQTKSQTYSKSCVPLFQPSTI